MMYKGKYYDFLLSKKPEVRKDKICKTDYSKLDKGDGSYSSFIHSEYWHLVRLQVLRRDRYKCKYCGTTKKLHVHHLTYKHFKNEMEHLDELITLCKDCHHLVHEYKEFDDELHNKMKK